MNKPKKLYIMFVLTLISSLIIPIFTQWYEQKTGIFPVAFYLILIIGGFISYLAAFTNNFKDTWLC